MGRDPLSSSLHNEEELPLGAEFTVKYKISTLRHQALNCRQEKSTGSNTYICRGQDSIPAGHRPGLRSLPACLGRASPPPGILTGRRRKPPSSQTQITAAARSASCNRNRVYFCITGELAQGKLRIAKTEQSHLLSPEPGASSRTSRTGFPYFHV